MEKQIPSSADLDANPGYQLWLAANALQRALQRGLNPLRLTFVQFFVLAAVENLGLESPSVSQAQVCRFSGMDPNMVSQVARTLVAKGLLERSANPADRRAHCLALTVAGETLVVAARERVMPISDAFVATLGERQRDLAQMLHQVVEAAES